MVRLLCLEEDLEDTSEPPEHTSEPPEHGRPNPNLNGFSAALSCYPIASQLASSLDLTSLHELSRTCRQFRANLLQYRQNLIDQSLRCENERANPAALLGDALSRSFEAWTMYGQEGRKVDRLTSGRVGACARDMVGECRKCNKMVCRNCVLKPPPQATLKGRHRRLCRTCMKAPLARLTSVVVNDEISRLRSSAFTHAAFARSPCSCPEQVWLCQPCGHALRTSDTAYMRGFAWRSRYSVCGGMGAGLGEGNEGVECGRGSDCLAAQEVYKEVECDADELAALEEEMLKAEVDGHSWQGCSYAHQEIVGIGGAVKKKVKKRMMLGGAVKEYEDERGSATAHMQREQTGANRSWCSWCARVVPGKKDLERPNMSTESVSSSSSGSSM